MYANRSLKIRALFLSMMPLQALIHLVISYGFLFEYLPRIEGKVIFSLGLMFIEQKLDSLLETILHCLFNIDLMELC
jgi:hypothetical protein